MRSHLRTRAASLAAFAILPLVLASCGDATDTEPAAASPGASPPGKYDAAPAMSLDGTKTYAATIVTAKGAIELSLDAKAAPVTVNNFVFLAREKYYDGLTFHRVEPGFVIQGGDPSGDGSGGPGYTIPDEQSRLPHVDGALAMAKTSAPNSAGSQFYITNGPQPALDARYTVFGLVTNGLDVVRTIARGDVIERITIAEK